MFTIKRQDVVKKVGACELIAVFDEAVKRQKVTDGVLKYPNGWQDEDSARVMRRSPKAFYLMSSAKLIPVKVEDALRMILDAGLTIERSRGRRATPRSPKATNASILLMQASGRRVTPTQSSNLPEAPLPDRYDSVTVETLFGR